jgi:Ca2+-binding EF-hand superfamily protein
MLRLLLIFVSVFGTAACTERAVAPFPVLDRDRNGQISQQEATQDRQLTEIFPYVDADRDGELSAFEYLQAATRE